MGSRVLGQSATQESPQLSGLLGPLRAPVDGLRARAGTSLGQAYLGLSLPTVYMGYTHQLRVCYY